MTRRSVNRAADGPLQLGRERVEVDFVTQPLGEGVRGQLRIVAAAIEPSIDSPLDGPPDGLEQGERDKR